MSLPRDPFGRSRVPLAALDRAGRVALLATALAALEAGEPVPPDAARLLARALDGLLRRGQRFEVAARIAAPRGSHATPTALLRTRGRFVVDVHDDADAGPRAPTARRTFRASSSR